MLPSRCPGTLIMARCPIMFLPRLLVLVRLKPASSTKTAHDPWHLPLAPSLSRQDKTNSAQQAHAQHYSMHFQIQYQWYYSLPAHSHIAAVFTRSLFSFKRYSVDLFHSILLRASTRPNTEMLTLCMFWKVVSSSIMRCWISRSLMELFAITILTIWVSCSAVNFLPLPPASGRLAILLINNFSIFTSMVLLCFSLEYGSATNLSAKWLY